MKYQNKMKVMEMEMAMESNANRLAWIKISFWICCKYPLRVRRFAKIL